MEISSWQWSTIWTAVAAIGAWAAVIVYYRTLTTLSRTHQTLTAQTVAATKAAQTAALSNIIEQISYPATSALRQSTIYSKQPASKINTENFQDIVSVFDRCALLAASDDEIRERLLMFKLDDFQLLAGKFRSSIENLRSGIGGVARPNYARHLLELLDWGVEKAIINPRKG